MTDQITCHNCGQDHSPTASFCPNCGEKTVAYKFCRSCGTRNAADARYCEECRHDEFSASRTSEGGAEADLRAQVVLQPQFVYCLECGTKNAADATFCSNCRHTGFRGANVRDEEPVQYGEPAAYDQGQQQVLLSNERVIGLMVVSAGLYGLWWFYKTWEQLRDESEDPHFPFWHAMTLFVPIYSLFRLHAHVNLIYKLCSSAGTSPTFVPMTIIWMAIVATVLAVISSWTPIAVAIMLNLMVVVISTWIIAWVQRDLNAYWEHTRGAQRSVASTPTGVGEVILTALGAASWLLLFV